MRPLATSLLAALCIAHGLAAQAPRAVSRSLPRATAVRAMLEGDVCIGLRSRDPAIVAWSAYTAAELRLAGCIPALRARLGTLPPTGSDGTQAAALTILDALIQTGAKVPPDELAPFAVSQRTPVMVLVQRDPAAHRETLRRMFGDAAPWLDDERRACGDRLAGLRDAEFARLLVFGSWQLDVNVVDRDEKVTTLLPGQEVIIACGRRRAVQGFPPLSRHGFEGRFVHCEDVATGPPFRGGLHCEHYEGYASFRLARAEWLEQMLGPVHRARIDAVARPVTIEWRGRAWLDHDVARACRDAARPWRALVATCIEAGLLAAGDATARMPSVAVEYLDWRSEAIVSLPLGTTMQRELGR